MIATLALRPLPRITKGIVGDDPTPLSRVTLFSLRSRVNRQVQLNGCSARLGDVESNREALASAEGVSTVP